eukprot:768651-Hanusia_phi.AAC.4
MRREENRRQREESLTPTNILVYHTCTTCEPVVAGILPPEHGPARSLEHILEELVQSRQHLTGLIKNTSRQDLHQKSEGTEMMWWCGDDNCGDDGDYDGLVVVVVVDDGNGDGDGDDGSDDGNSGGCGDDGVVYSDDDFDGEGDDDA